jgi:hypothetical protein
MINYLVSLYVGAYEDSGLCCLNLLYQREKEYSTFTPQQLLARFKADFKESLLKHVIKIKRCPRCEYKCTARMGNYCPGCGTRLSLQKEEVEDFVLAREFRNLFEQTCDTSSVFFDDLRELGWDIYTSERPDIIMTITGADIFLEDENRWFTDMAQEITL